MAQREDFVTDNTDLEAGSGRNSREIRSEIDRTRSDMDETFAALDAKLTPKEIGLELWNLFKGGSSTGASKLWQVAREHPMPAAVVGLGLGWLLVESSSKSDKDAYDGRYRGEYRGSGDYNYGRGSYRQGYAGTGSYSGSEYDSGYESDESSGLLSAAGDKVKDLAGSAKDALSGAGDKVSDAADWTKEHASDLGHQVADKASSLGHQVADRASSLGHQVKDRVSGLGPQTRRQARRAKLGFWQTMEENPLMVGAAVLALGVIAGLAVPSTDKEDELMGETRDRLFDDVKEAGQQALDKGKHVAEAVVDKVKEEAQHQGLTAEGVVGQVKSVANKLKEEAQNQGLTAESVVDKVKNVAKEATNTAKEEAKRQNLTVDAAANALKPDQPQGQQAQGQPAQPAAQNLNDPAKKAEVHEPEFAKR